MDHAAATAELIKMVSKRGLASAKGEIEKLQRLLEQGADPNAFVNKHESVLLRFLKTSHDKRCIEILLQHGADPNLSRPLPKHDYKFGYGETPLAVAVTSILGDNSLLWTRQLLNAGAEVNRFDSQGYTALDHLLSPMVSLSSQTLDHLQLPIADMTTYGVVQIFFGRVDPLLECADELLQHGAEATSAKIPVPEILHRVKVLWNRCVEWVENYQPEPSEIDDNEVICVSPAEE
jgi:hypothetical protein